MKRPKRENYPNGIYGDISYNDRLERYTSYVENRLKEREQALRIHDVIKSVCPDCGYPIFKKSFEHYYRCEGCEWTGQTVL